MPNYIPAIQQKPIQWAVDIER